MSTIQPALFDLPQVKVDVPDRLGKVAAKEISAASILTATKGKGSLAYFDYSLNPYRGCGFGCSYCYAAFFEPHESKRESWGNWVEVKANAIDLLNRAKDLGGKRICMSSATDPYQPIEREVELTREILIALTDRPDQPELVIQTRGPLVTRDIDILRKLKSVRVNMSITTDSDEIRKRFEPTCASIERRLEALRELHAAGIVCGVSIAPMLPIEDPVGFARTLRDLDVEHYWAGYFHSSDRLFAGNTRSGALEIAKEFEWTYSKYQRTKAVLERLIPRFGGFAEAARAA